MSFCFPVDPGVLPQASLLLLGVFNSNPSFHYSLSALDACTQILLRSDLDIASSGPNLNFFRFQIFCCDSHEVQFKALQAPQLRFGSPGLN